MNFLAHAVLSFEKPEILVGNFIADFVKGKDYLDYPELIRNGIMLHREIDNFTDSHPRVIQSKRKLYEKFGHYSGVIVDMYYDHFLAANFFKFHILPLESFTQFVYTTVGEHRENIPKKASMILKFMFQGDWLQSYSKIIGIEQALSGMARRTKFKSNMEYAGQSLRDNYESFHTDFMIFFPKIMAFSKQQIEQL